MTKVLLLGATGQLGAAVRKVFDGLSISVSGPARTEFDADRDAVDDALAPFTDHDYLINCIAYHKVDQCEADIDRSFRTNAVLVFNLARFCHAKDIALMHISTDYVFDGRKRAPYVETDLPRPLNVYGASKLAGEYLARTYAPKHFVLRVSSLFGEKKTGDRTVSFVEKMIDAARRGQELNVIKDQIMSPTFTEDAAEAMGMIIKSKCTDYGIYHLCNSGECSWYDYAQTIFELTGLTNKLTPVTYTEYHTAAKRPQFCSMDNSKISPLYQMRPWTDALGDHLSRMGYRSGKAGP
ncbi:MAG: dTDP-4-dehydrorhamnose reductase [Candidatus Zixiibacteriota bacterium]|nr:MAG: dTDP-4-dehydrorhamnose reductase [candidate division Zixibacteria bacterium]